MPSFQFLPFPSNTAPNIDITGEVERIDNHLSIRFEVGGNIEQIILPERSNSSTRKHDLWKETCFEFFLAVLDQPQYWEFNMSPSGDWNVYKMDAYRRVGFREEELIQQMQVKVQKEANGFVLHTNIDLTPLFQKEHVLEAGITAVIQSTDGTQSYWALTHPGQQADFHFRESFIVKL
jgi:hypothetical protein